MKKRLPLFRSSRHWIALYWISFAFLFLPLILCDQIGISLALFLFSGVLFFIPTLLPSDSLFGPIITQFPTSRKELWLTIDDGPDPQDTPCLLDLLDHYQAKATFFVIGAKAKEHPHLIQEILQRGHSIGNHTQSHPVSSFWIALPHQLRKELSLCQKTITQIAPLATPTLFRAPVGMTNFFLHPILSEQKLTLVGWSARGFDTVADCPEKVVQRIWKQVTPGAIILLHEGIALTQNGERIAPQILERLLQKLAQEHYQCLIPNLAIPLPTNG